MSLNKSRRITLLTVGNMQPMLNRLKGLGLSDFFVIRFFVAVFLKYNTKLYSIHLMYPKMMTMYCFKRSFLISPKIIGSSLICARKGDMTPIQCLTRTHKRVKEFGAVLSYSSCVLSYFLLLKHRFCGYMVHE